MKGELFKKEEKNVSAPPVLVRNYLALRVLDLSNSLARFVTELNEEGKTSRYTKESLIENIVFLYLMFKNVIGEISEIENYLYGYGEINDVEIVKIANKLIRIAFEKKLINIFQLKNIEIM